MNANVVIILVLAVQGFSEYAVGASSRPVRKSVPSRPSDEIDAPNDRADHLKRLKKITSLMLQDPEFWQDRSDNEALIEDFAEVPFTCPHLPPSDSIPTSVHTLRPSDVNFVGALGDSITAGNGVRAKELYQVFVFANRGESFSVGGEKSLDEGAITLTNILKKYNKDVGGGSYCARSRTHAYSGLNVAVPGAVSRGLLSQARELIFKFAEDLDVFYDSWKVVTLLIGGNDMCQHCQLAIGGNFTAENYRDGIKAALDLMHAHLPRTFVNVVAMATVGVVKDLKHPGNEAQCESLHAIECPCALSNTTEEMKSLQMEYFNLTNALIASGVYDTRRDFTVVMQPYLVEQEPFLMNSTHYDMSFFAPDCFHPGVKTHQAFAIQLWNSMLTKVGSKPLKHDESEPVEYLCPTEEKPYFYTSQNSQ